jgi:hypothetical protein
MDIKFWICPRGACTALIVVVVVSSLRRDARLWCLQEGRKGVIASCLPFSSGLVELNSRVKRCVEPYLVFTMIPSISTRDWGSKATSRTVCSPY